MSRLDIHKHIGELLESLAINNNRLSLHDEALSELDLAVLRQHCVALYNAINQLNSAPVVSQMEPESESNTANVEPKAEPPVENPVLEEEPKIEAPAEVKEEEAKSIHMRMQDEAEMVSLFEKFNSKPIDNISKSISISKRFEFQNNFFDGDAKEYKEFISLIDGAGDREAAFEVYHEYKNRLNWENEDLKDELKSLLYRKYAT
ncbi:MAG: hypothetical protein JXR19_11515 [Bacteroidia bacterium]